jgi:PAS domain S-box-containing protein
MNTSRCNQLGNDELEKLKQEIAENDLLLSCGTEGIAITENGKILFANEQIAKLLGYTSAKEIIGFSVSKFVAARSQKLVMDNITKEKSKPYQSFSIRKDGTEFPTLTFASQTEFLGKIVRITTIRDISEFYNSQIQLEASNRRYKSLFNQIPITVWEEDASDVLKYAKDLGLDKIDDLQNYLDSNPDIVLQGLSKLIIKDVNTAALELLEVTDKNILFNSISDFFTENAVKSFSKPMTAIVKKEKNFEMESEFITATGKLIDIHIYWRVLPGYEEDYSRIITVITDISERNKAEAEKRKIYSKFEQVQKLESLENFASGISNDFNNLLVGILGNASLALNQIDPASPISDLLK